MGSEAEIQTERLPAAWQACRIPRRRERWHRKAKEAADRWQAALEEVEMTPQTWASACRRMAPVLQGIDAETTDDVQKL
jgi:hypothetical protein